MNKFTQKHIINALIAFISTIGIMIFVSIPVFLIALVILWSNPFIISEWSGRGIFFLCVYYFAVLIFIVQVYIDVDLESKY